MTTLLCSAKFNLFLAITGKDASGYHTLETVLVRLPQLADKLHLEPAEQTTLSCTDPSVPTNESNTLLKALNILEEYTGQKLPHKLHLEKNIPPGTGLGGASSNAASLMLHLNETLQISQETLLQLGAKVGMDVPFFLTEYTVAHGIHYGEIIQPLPRLPAEIQFEIHLPQSHQLTQSAYEKWDTAGHQSPAQIQPMLDAIHQQNTEAIIQNRHNDFELIYSPAAVASEQILAGSGAAVISLHRGDKRSPNR